MKTRINCEKLYFANAHRFCVVHDGKAYGVSSISYVVAGNVIEFRGVPNEFLIRYTKGPIRIVCDEVSALLTGVTVHGRGMSEFNASENNTILMSLEVIAQDIFFALHGKKMEDAVLDYVVE